MNLVIIDYKAGNTRSVIHCLQRMGIEPVLTSDKNLIASADKIIFPGVGEAGFAMKSLREVGLDVLIPQLKQPLLGICLGMQLLCSHSEESDTKCLGIFPMEVKRFDSIDLKIPHMGWNQVRDTENPLFSQFDEGKNFYFVHSYYVPISQYTNSICDYIQPFSAGIQRENFYGAQFHPEKSDKAGKKLIENFLAV
jgi:imidazole glycerol-phosphate synthase subunit HisH